MKGGAVWVLVFLGKDQTAAATFESRVIIRTQQCEIIVRLLPATTNVFDKQTINYFTRAYTNDNHFGNRDVQ